ncbi:hypothetical protein [Micromonospora sp. NPDC049645]|uniref:hypothetical protein n=1 Tax=Micromonospora sp. NPDC049645 TaxID=3155508 RepID=UPI003422AFBF
MSSSRLAGSVTRRVPPAAAIRTGTVVELLPPSLDESDRVTGWQVRLDVGGGQVLNAGVAGGYEPYPGDQVAVIAYLGRLFVIDRVTAGGDAAASPPGRLVRAASAPAGTYASATGATEVDAAALSSQLADVELRDGGAYEVLLRTGYTTSAASSYVHLRLRQDTVTTGTDLGEWFRQPVTVAGLTYGMYGRLVIANRTGYTLPVDLLIVLAAPAGVTASLTSLAASPAYVEINRLGHASRYPHAVSVTAPPVI